jgi:hypothetical protein
MLAFKRIQELKTHVMKKHPDAFLETYPAAKGDHPTHTLVMTTTLTFLHNLTLTLLHLYTQTLTLTHTPNLTLSLILTLV